MCQTAAKQEDRVKEILKQKYTVSIVNSSNIAKESVINHQARRISVKTDKTEIGAVNMDQIL